MWIVRKIGALWANGTVQYETNFILSQYGIQHFSLAIHLQETETGMYKVIKNKGNPNFIDELRQISPYGFIDRNPDRQGLALDDFFCVIDDLSLKFLDYVDTVTYETVSTRSDKSSFVKDLNGEFIAADADMSIFICDVVPSRGMVATLFHTVCYDPTGWHDDGCFYLYSRRTLNMAYEEDIVDIIYKVKFINPAEAKRFVTRATVLTDNPIKAFVKAFKEQ